ncbi:glycolipid 2-alpha-mannosyltransferase-domain-containing protein, partial [Mycena rebaudengoi]
LIPVRNSELIGPTLTIRQLEEKFNRKFGYPYVFLNDQPFTDQFKNGILTLTKAPVQFGLIPHDHWNQPDWIDEVRAARARRKMAWHYVLHFFSSYSSYRNMCRFNSGFFYRHELLKPFKYYWRCVYSRRYAFCTSFDLPLCAELSRFLLQQHSML